MTTHTPSPTGRLNQSEPEQQYFPGSFGDRVMRRQLQKGREAMARQPQLVSADISELEMRIVRNMAANGTLKVKRCAS